MIYSAPFNPLPFQGACPLATPWPTIVLADGARRRLPAVACRLCRGRGQCARAVGPGDIDILDAVARAPRAWVADNLSLPPASQWRLSFEQGRRLEGARDPDLYQMLLAWFQHEILGLLCGLLFFLPLIYLRQWPNCLGHLHQRQLLCHHLQFRFCHGD